MSRASRAVALTGLVAVIGAAGTATTTSTASAATLPNPIAAASSILSGISANLATSELGLFSSLPSNYSTKNDTSSLLNLTSSLGARTLWGQGKTGQGVSVGVIDSGISAVSGLTVAQSVDLSSTNGTSASAKDGFGHGTAMAGVIAGHDSGSLTGNNTFNGVAPGASLVNIKVADPNGWSDPSRIIAAVAWAIQHKDDAGRPAIRVLNLSYGTDSTQGYKADPVAYAVEQAWKAGIVVVASAGNDGRADGHLLDPALDPYVIAVGASTTANLLGGGVASFSNAGDGTRNPDVIAPGVSIQTLRAPGSLVDQLVPASGSPSRFIKGSGTSEATAVVSGLAALLISAHPSITPDQVKADLTGTALRLPGVSDTLQGHGLASLAFGAAIAFPAPAQSYPASLGNGSLDASRGNDSWIAAGATPAEAENPALMGGPTGEAWAGRAWSGRAWSGSSWAADADGGDLCGRAWSGRSWS